MGNQEVKKKWQQEEKQKDLQKEKQQVDQKEEDKLLLFLNIFFDYFYLNL